jgi:hypothetical protein
MAVNGILVITGILIVWCIVAMGFLWGSWNNRDDTIVKTSIALSTPALFFSACVFTYFFGQEAYSD